MSELDEAKARARDALDRQRPLLAKWKSLAMPYALDRSLVPDKETVRLINEAHQELEPAQATLGDAIMKLFRLERDPERLARWIEELKEE